MPNEAASDRSDNVHPDTPDAESADSDISADDFKGGTHALQTGAAAADADAQRWDGVAAAALPEGPVGNEGGDEDQTWIHGDLDEEDEEVDENVSDTSSVAFQRREEQLNAPDPTPAQVVRSNFTVIAAVLAGVLVAFVKFLASFLTGSVAMFSEGIHSLVDACNDSLLLIGTRKSKKKPDIEHPFGFGRELYFYAFVVSVVIFLFGGGVSIFRGITSLMHGGSVIEDPLINYIVLVIGIVVEGFSFAVAWKDVKRARAGRSLFEYIRDSKSPINFTVLLEDTAAELGMVIALAGIYFSIALDLPQLDSVASIIIGALMAAIAVVLLRETRSLLIGEGLTRDEIDDVVFIVEQDPAVIKCGRVLSMYMGPSDMLLTLDVTFDDELDEGDVLQAIDRIEAELIDDFPQCTSIFIEAESLNQVYRQRHDRRQAFEAEMDDEEDRERQEQREREFERERALLRAEVKKAAKKAAKKEAKKAAKKEARKVEKKAEKRKAKEAAAAAQAHPDDADAAVQANSSEAAGLLRADLGEAGGEQARETGGPAREAGREQAREDGDS